MFSHLFATTVRRENPTFLNNFGILLEASRNGKVPTVPSEILVKLTHLSTFFHLFDALVTLFRANQAPEHES